MLALSVDDCASVDMMYEMIGNPNTEEGKRTLHDASPLFFVDRIVTPLLVAQGANDPRVKQAESDRIVSALRERGVDVQYLLKENEGHGFLNEENRIEFYETMVTFLNTHLEVNRTACARSSSPHSHAPPSTRPLPHDGFWPDLAPLRCSPEDPHLPFRSR